MKQAEHIIKRMRFWSVMIGRSAYKDGFTDGKSNYINFDNIGNDIVSFCAARYTKAEQDLHEYLIDNRRIK